MILAAPHPQLPAAILLDKDGVLVDFHRTWKPAIKQAAAKVAAMAENPAGIGRLAHELLAAVGYEAARDTFLPGSIWAAGTQEELFDAWAALLPALPRAHIARTVGEVLRAATPQPVVEPAKLLPLMRQARAAGFRLAIVTNDLTESARATARLQGMDSLLDAVIGADLCTRPKPHPDLVHEAERALGLPATRMVMVGDNVHDGEMARRGGCAGFIGVLSGTSGAADLQPLADALAADVGEALRLLLLQSETTITGESNQGQGS